MANIGPTTAFYKVETSLTHAHNEVGNSRERIAAGKQSAHAGDRASNSAMIDAFRLDHVSAKAGIKGASFDAKLLARPCDDASVFICIKSIC